MNIRKILVSMMLPVILVSCDHCGKLSAPPEDVTPATNPAKAARVRQTQTMLDREILFRENGLQKDHYFAYTNLILAARDGDVAKVQILLKNEKDVNWKMQWGLTALIWAANQGHTQVVELLCVHGADVNLLSEEGMTALMYAAREGHVDSVKVLLKSGARVQMKNPAGKTAAQMARENGYEDIAKLLSHN
jgi:ankyrin repeat protein